ncbi:YhcH/YjgK/YiaL family protein [Paenibacillus shirakamiensis]|uniref:YhcH/YjgK/YiaL family protein n=1 Tax=Paenibacillus shirakamiensis TaxID=1265935 RepID=A0ABS4JKD3_9BACL|nr:YhcH/YjgK/YiaL family protein [Paenibacillus shirakamiensis]MBP2002168.1 YhcH/YjgK/YiaL family protein [Paenibacillus shirakamiensis]
MILGSRHCWSTHARFEHPVITQAIEELERLLQQQPEVGRTDIQGDDIYVSIMEIDAKSLDEQVAEKHESYIDVHYLIEGEEILGWAPLVADMEPLQPYDAEGEYALYTPAKNEVLLTLHPGMFAVFFPHDLHRPSMGESGKIKKAVIKIHVGLLARDSN